MAGLHFELVTPDRVVMQEDDVSIVVAPGTDGQLGILPHHAPLITTLKPGELKVRREGEETLIAVTGGFMEVTPDRVLVLADAAERAEEIDLARAEEARRRAEEAIQQRLDVEEMAAAEAALRRSLIRIRIAQRRRGGPTRPME